MLDIPVTTIFENAVTGVMVVVYLFIEIHYGRVSKLASQLDAVIDSVMALAREHDNIDEQKVADRLNGHTPEDLIRKKDGKD